jgi:hypothetical protein
MKTDDLIAMLSTNVEPVQRGAIWRAIGTAVIVGVLAAIAVMLLALGVRPDLAAVSALIYLPLKLGFAILTIILATLGLTQLARPGGERRASIALALLPLLFIILLGAFSVATVSRAHWERMIVGDQWLECLISIPIIAIAPFAAIVWVLRKMAPTNLTRAGFFAGLVAGGSSATAYALHCSDDSIAFVMVWYGGTIALCAGAGALLGPRLLRW